MLIGDRQSIRFSYRTSILTSIITFVTFVIAVSTPPLSGPFCTSGCYKYPYHDIASRFPRDYYWMYAAFFLIIAYGIFIICIHYHTASYKKLYSSIAVVFATITTAVFVIDYFLQLSVVQPSLINEETDGIALITQFNPHGIFIVLEELGFIMMSFSFLFIALTYSAQNKLEKAIRWIFLAGFFLVVLAFVLISIIYGLNREYLFEVAVISISWLVLLVNSFLQSLLFRRQLRMI